MPFGSNLQHLQRLARPSSARRSSHPTHNYLLQAQGGPQLLKTTSDLLLQAQAFQQVRGRNACAGVLAHAPHVPRPGQAFATALCPNWPPLQPKGVTRLLDEEGKTNSVDSSSTAAGQSGAAHTLLHDSATASLLPPLRQISLDVIAATELNRGKGLGGQERERGAQNIFQDVFNEVRCWPLYWPPPEPGLISEGTASSSRQIEYAPVGGH